MCRRLTAKLSAVATDNVRRSVPVGPRRICGGSADLLKLAWNANQIGAIFNHSICKVCTIDRKIELLRHTFPLQGGPDAVNKQLLYEVFVISSVIKVGEGLSAEAFGFS